jgi:hypothetical protein
MSFTTGTSGGFATQDLEAWNTVGTAYRSVLVDGDSGSVSTLTSDAVQIVQSALEIARVVIRDPTGTPEDVAILGMTGQKGYLTLRDSTQGKDAVTITSDLASFRDSTTATDVPLIKLNYTNASTGSMSLLYDNTNNRVGAVLGITDLTFKDDDATQVDQAKYGALGMILQDATTTSITASILTSSSKGVLTLRDSTQNTNAGYNGVVMGTSSTVFNDVTTEIAEITFGYTTADASITLNNKTATATGAEHKIYKDGFQFTNNTTAAAIVSLEYGLIGASIGQNVLQMRSIDGTGDLTANDITIKMDGELGEITCEKICAAGKWICVDSKATNTADLGEGGIIWGNGTYAASSKMFLRSEYVNFTSALDLNVPGSPTTDRLLMVAGGTNFSSFVLPGTDRPLVFSKYGTTTFSTASTSNGSWSIGVGSTGNLEFRQFTSNTAGAEDFILKAFIRA